ncbi:unnamed protein product [Pipistrellus nathusii]|uniref:Uncharacterized protein n=1 Tax=Pipistrellus nathusii TaxID=59473 RepID=A0ABN9Z0T1_PIPNA
MASLRSSRPGCIRAAFSAPSTRASLRRRQRNALQRLKVNHRKSYADFVEGIWREWLWRQFLDPYAGLEDAPAHLACGIKDCSPGDVTCHGPSHTPTPRSPGVHSGDPPSSEDPASPGDDDVDMQPAEMTEENRGPLLPPGEPPEAGRRVQGRARASRTSPGLGSEKDKAPKLALSKRKLELLLSEPEKRKRRKQHGA